MSTTYVPTPFIIMTTSTAVPKECLEVKIHLLHGNIPGEGRREDAGWREGATLTQTNLLLVFEVESESGVLVVHMFTILLMSRPAVVQGVSEAKRSTVP